MIKCFVDVVKRLLLRWLVFSFRPASIRFLRRAARDLPPGFYADFERSVKGWRVKNRKSVLYYGQEVTDERE